MITILKASLHLHTQQEIERAYTILIYAYQVTELEIWGANYSRLSIDEFKNLIQLGEVYFASIDDEIVGSIHVSLLKDKTHSFGLLSVDFDKKGLGIGRKLIETAESHAKFAGSDHMELEILRPRDMELPQKVQLHEWYQRMGYKFIESMSFEQRKPQKADKAKRLIRPTLFDCYLKAI